MEQVWLSAVAVLDSIIQFPALPSQDHFDNAGEQVQQPGNPRIIAKPPTDLDHLMIIT